MQTLRDEPPSSADNLTHFSDLLSSGDCWLLSAIASLSMHPSLLKQVMPPGQSFQDGYNGCFVFRFWQYGQWEEVKIDDLLPTQDSKLIYLNSPEKYEFWSSLLEKAYAKLKGGYRALNMGFPHEAMVDMTGGVAEVLNIAAIRELPALLSYLLAKRALINCANSQGPLEQGNPLGIRFRHAYSLTAVEKVKTAYGTEDLVRILNPWGNTEWEGPWSDMNGPEWNTVSFEEQKRLGRVSREDGEFWMSVSDFRQNFDMMEVCHRTDESETSGLPWYCIMHHGNWVPGISNPQFYFTLLEVDRDQKTCSFVLALMQKYQRRMGVDLSIGLHIYPDLTALQPLLCNPQHSPRREVVLRGSLPPGRYIIIPSTAEPNQQGAFLLRVLTEQGNAKGLCKPVHLYNLLTEIIQGGVLAGSEKYLALEHCKSLVILMDSQGSAQLTWQEFQILWDKIKRWTVRFQTHHAHQHGSFCLSAPGIMVDELIMQLVGLRYTEPDLTISYPGFLYLLMKLESMIRKAAGAHCYSHVTVFSSHREILHFLLHYIHLTALVTSYFTH
uniref:Zgc:85932 n=1 Tax=Sander lucioperca TaxID=283035 RepID=A0A8C9Z1C6_SANLU